MGQKFFVLLLLFHSDDSEFVLEHFFQIFLESQVESEPAQLIGISTFPEIHDHFFLVLLEKQILKVQGVVVIRPITPKNSKMTRVIAGCLAIFDQNLKLLETE